MSFFMFVSGFVYSKKTEFHKFLLKDFKKILQQTPGLLEVIKNKGRLARGAAGVFVRVSNAVR
jgi:hypothetical protein